MGIFDRARRGPIRRTSRGTYTIDLEPQVRELIGNFTEQLRELLGTDSELLVRLFPPPYGDDEERNAGYALLAGAELRERRIAALDEVRDHLHADELDEAQLMAWMRAVNDVRLVLGTMLGITDDHELPDLDDEDLGALQVYEFLGAVLDAIVSALSD